MRRGRKHRFRPSCHVGSISQSASVHLPGQTLALHRQVAANDAMSVTTTLKVRTGRSIWQGTPVPALHKVTLRRDTTTDVLVVGAGISGALVAEALTDAGLKVLIVDKGAPLSGATSASTALLQYEIAVPPEGNDRPRQGASPLAPFAHGPRCAARAH